MRRTQYIEVEVDIEDILPDISDEELIEEVESRNLNGINVDALNQIHYAAQRKDHKTISRILEDLIYEKMGRVIAIDF